MTDGSAIYVDGRLHNITDIDPSMIPLDLALFMLVGYVVYFFLIVVGIPANCFVLVRMLHFKRRCPDTYRMGTGACLLAMSIADLVSLISILLLCLTSFGVEFGFSDIVYRLICKLSIFSLHTATSIAIWSWLLMSILRWLALYRPLLHHTLYNLPVKAVGVVTLSACITNVWLLIVVDAEKGQCTHGWLFGNELVSRILLVAEMIWSFVLPIVVVAYLDLSTLLSIPRLISARYSDSLLQPEMHAAHDRHMKKSTKTLLRWLAIALVDILLNAPENILRLSTILGFFDDDDAGSNSYLIFKTISDVFYYSQYSFNAAYLALFIYDRATSSSPIRRDHSSFTPTVHPSTRPTPCSSTVVPNTNAIKALTCNNNRRLRELSPTRGSTKSLNV